MMNKTCHITPREFYNDMDAGIGQGIKHELADRIKSLVDGQRLKVVRIQMY